MSPATSTIASVSSTGKLTVAGVIATTSVATIEDGRVEQEDTLVEAASLDLHQLRLGIILTHVQSWKTSR